MPTKLTRSKSYIPLDDKTFIFDGLQDIVSDKFIEKAWNMIYERYKIYENL